MNPLKRALLERLPRYYHIVCDLTARGDEENISSAQIAELMGVDDTQVRKDLAAIQVRGCPRIGYSISKIKKSIRDVLGFDNIHRAIIIGAGRLGGALAAYPGFSTYGLEVVAMFDVSPKLVGENVGELPILPLSQLENVIQTRSVDMAILTVPAAEAQIIAERIASAGVRAIWNFAPIRFAAPEGVAVRHEEISVGLAELSYHLKEFRER